jgi:hypothetical protein
MEPATPESRMSPEQMNTFVLTLLADTLAFAVDPTTTSRRQSGWFATIRRCFSRHSVNPSGMPGRHGRHRRD